MQNGEIEWLSQPLSWFESWLLGHQDEPLQLAREFVLLSDDDRKWWPINREAGARQRWEQLLPALQRLCFPENSRSIEWVIGSWSKELAILPQDYSPFHFYHPAVQELAKLLKATYDIKIKHPRYFDIGVRGKKQTRHSPSFTATAPTQHELLEAALQWRDFGREIGQSKRVESALNQLLNDKP